MWFVDELKCLLAVCCVQGIVVTIDRKVDDNWYSGTFGEKKGIFPAAYVQLMEGKKILQ